MLSAQLAAIKPSSWRIAEGEQASEADGLAQSWITFETATARGNGFIRIRNGQIWTVAVRDNGVAVFSGRRVTKAPSGSFSVEFRTPNRAGADKFVGTARNTRTGEVCTARVTY